MPLRSTCSAEPAVASGLIVAGVSPASPISWPLLFQSGSTRLVTTVRPFGLRCIFGHTRVNAVQRFAAPSLPSLPDCRSVF